MVAGAALATMALDRHLGREGKDNHARALLESAHRLQLRLAEMADLWAQLEGHDHEPGRQGLPPTAGA